MNDREIAFIRAIAARMTAIALASLSGKPITQENVRLAALEMGARADKYDAEWERAAEKMKA